MNQALINPSINSIPTSLRHVAIIMDGNNRYAKKHGLPSGQGHIAGKDRLDEIVEHAFKSGVDIMTVFAFSSENWQRPLEEVALLMELLEEAIDDQVPRMLANKIGMRFIGDRSKLTPSIQAKMRHAEQATQDFTKHILNIAISYGGQWDLVQSAKKLAHKVALGQLHIDDISTQHLEELTELGHLPAVDLLIRTGGEYRISNFLLWQLAYAELYFSPLLWPEFTANDFDDAVTFYQGRERRFGKTQEQVLLGHNL